MNLSLLTLIAATTVSFGVEVTTPVSVTQNEWTITADPQQAMLTVAHERLGLVLKDARLQLRGERVFLPLKNWTIRKQGSSRLVVETAQPVTAWAFDLCPISLPFPAPWPTRCLRRRRRTTAWLSGSSIPRACPSSGVGPTKWSRVTEEVRRSTVRICRDATPRSCILALGRSPLPHSTAFSIARRTRRSDSAKRRG